MARKRFAIVGTGGRSGMFWRALSTDYKQTSELVALCDMNQTRMDFTNREYAAANDGKELATYKTTEFDKMITEQKIDTVIVTTLDRRHHTYIIRAMELGCDAITEKPMTVDEVKCQAILDTIQRTGKQLRVTFNYRYAPFHTKIRELIMNDTIGKVHAVHFEWMLDTRHGADYFRRWHRDKRNSGGLMVHKATHHFDLVNWWIGAQPSRVFAFGDLRFYGRENAENRGQTRFYARAADSEHAKTDPFALHLDEKDKLKELYRNAEHEDGYYRDQSVFGDGINIEDTMSVLVKYNTGASMSYQLTAYSPWEGYNISFTGDKGRIEATTQENSYVNAGGDAADEGAHMGKALVVRPMHGKPYKVEVEESEGGHGGGDKRLLDDIFGDPVEDPYKRAASHVDGAMSILTGIGANKAFATGMPTDIQSLVQFHEPIWMPKY